MIISAFPGVGKTYLYNNHPDLISDSDSSKFSWLEDGTRNPNFVKDYVDHIEKEASKKLFVFVSSHKEVRDELHRRGINFLIFYPSLTDKQIYIERYKKRGSSPEFIKLLDERWDEMIQSCAEDNAIKFEVHYPNMFLKDAPLFNFLHLN